MKDAYSLDVSEEALQESDRLHIGAYDRIYARCGLDCMMVKGDSGMMGGAISHEYMAMPMPARTRSSSAASAATPPTSRPGSPARTRSRRRANWSRTARPMPRSPRPRRAGRPARRGGARHAGLKTIDQVATYLGLPARAFIKALVVVPESGGEVGPVMVLVRGDHELGELKLRKALGADFRMATADEVLAAQGIEPGFVGPVPTPLPVFADEALRLGHYVAGANKPGFHRSGVTLAQVPRATFAVLRDARPGDPCAQCSGDLEGARVIEVGNIFQLGLKYPSRWERRSWTRTARSAPSSWAATASVGAHRRGRSRAASRRPRHLLAGEHRAVSRAPRPGARLRRRAAQPGRRLYSSWAQRASRWSTTTAT